LPLLVVNPIDFPHWDESLQALPYLSFFYTSSWAEVLHRSYGYEPVYFTMWEGGVLSALLPCMDIDSFLTGKRGVSLPFTDYCEPIVSDAGQFPEMLAAAIAFGKKQNWKMLEFRGGSAFMQGQEPSEWHYGHTLELTAGSQKIFSSLRDSTRRNIKKAEKEKVDATISASPEAVKAFCRLNALTRRDHGLPPQPRHFFQCVYDQIISKDKGFVSLASFKNKVIAANVYFNFEGQVIYKYGASDRAYLHLRANNLIMWEAIKWGCDHRYKTFCFGRTEPENEGLRQFKTGWGAREHIIKYYRYDLKKEAFIKASTIIHPLYKKAFKKLPIPVLDFMGTVLYSHMG
jgi:hypothetical protein